MKARPVMPANELKPGFITGTTNCDEVPHVRCTICGGYYKADESEDHQCEDTRG